MNFNSIQLDAAHSELAGLIQTLNETRQRILELTGGKFDAVGQDSAAPHLLPQAQEGLRESEAIQRHFATERAAILDALPANIALLDTQGLIITVNKAWRDFADLEQLSGRPYAIGTNYLSVCDNATGTDRSDGLATAEGIRAVINGEINSFTLEYPCHSPTTQRWFELRVSPLPQVHGYGAVVMHIDLTVRKTAEQKTEEIANRLERLIRKARIGIWVIEDMKPILVNDEAVRILGCASKDELIGVNFLDIFAEEDRARVEAYKQARLAGRKVPDLYSVKAKNREGREIILEIRAFAIRWGDRTAVCGMLTDVTEQRATEEKLRQSQRLEAVGQLTGGIAHDFNNLLTVILGNAELLIERLGHEPRLLALAQMAKTSAQRGADLTHRLLAFARRQTLEPEPTDVRMLVTDMEPLLHRSLGEDIDITIESNEALAYALIDASQLENAILNLCLNARDAMPNGGRLSIKMENVTVDGLDPRRHREIAPGNYVTISVSDTGIGMDEITLSKVFVPFFTTKDVGKGTGLGLSMVFGFTRQSGGHVKICSQPGNGTTVRMYLPQTDSSIIPTAAREETDEVPEGNERILLTEDDALVREHVGNLLESLGYSVITAANGADALKMLRADDSIDLLFTDIVMPNGMTGRQLADKAHDLRPELPVLFTSGYNDKIIISDGRLEPGIHLLKKPYRRQELAMKIRDVLANGKPAVGN